MHEIRSAPQDGFFQSKFVFEAVVGKCGQAGRERVQVLELRFFMERSGSLKKISMHCHDMTSAITSLTLRGSKLHLNRLNCVVDHLGFFLGG